MQTLANLSASRDVLRQVEINNGALARLEGYYANYKEALKFQLDQRKPDLLEALSPSSQTSPSPSVSSNGSNRTPARRMPSASFMAGSGSSVSPPPQGEVGGGMRRRKSLRESIGNDQLMNTVNTLAAKVVSHNDRCVLSK
jgi:hypothetical protein